jgi:flagellar basal body rod protein FlgG
LPANGSESGGAREKELIMLYGLYLSAAGMQAQESRQAIISNNLANAETTGFKRDLAVMQARATATQEDPAMRQYELPELKNQGGGVTIAGSGIDLTQGPLKESDNATDVALSGSGFFQVQGDKAGEKLLTRDGSFIVNSQGGLVTANGGRAVLSADGTPLVLNTNLPVVISQTGMISQGGNAGVQMGLVDVPDSRRLMKMGDNLLTVDKPDAMTAVPAKTQVAQWHLEESGVNPIVEMVNMMEGQRAFEANAKMITYQDTTLSELNTVGRVA